MPDFDSFLRLSRVMGVRVVDVTNEKLRGTP